MKNGVLKGLGSKITKIRCHYFREIMGSIKNKIKAAFQRYKQESLLRLRRIKLFLIRKKKDIINLKKERTRFLDFLSDYPDICAQDIYFEYMNSEFRKWYCERKNVLVAQRGNRSIASDFDCAILYILIRSFKPNTVVETGVLYGSSSSHILEALAKNGFGNLYSIDLPKAKNMSLQTFFVRGDVRDRWELIIGDAKVKLPELLSRLGSIDYFYHDSSHSFNHMFFEYETAFKYISSKGIISSHDVISLPFKKNAFKIFCKKHLLKYNVFRNVGFALCCQGNRRQNPIPL